MDDRQILELYHRRDENAIIQTGIAYGKYCYVIANNILCDHHDSEECVNDTYLRAWNSIPPQKPNSLKLFLAEITRNLALNRYKERKSKKRGGEAITVALEEIDEFVVGTTSIDNDLAEKELLSSINRFLRTLPKRNSNIFVMRYFHFHTVKAIAQMYGLTEENVSMILSRTRKKLKKHLETEGYIL